jgi:hypothetical protein
MGLQQLINEVQAAETQSRSKQLSGLSEEMARHSYRRPRNEYTARTTLSMREANDKATMELVGRHAALGAGFSDRLKNVIGFRCPFRTRS